MIMAFKMHSLTLFGDYGTHSAHPQKGGVA